MKIFVSGQIDEKEEINVIYQKLQQAGHEVTHDWTKTDGIGDKLKNQKESGLRAAKDITGVVEADIYILVSNNKKPGKGMYVELGAALALNEALGKPQIFTIGNRNHLSIFYLHPAVTHLKTIEDVLQQLDGTKQV
ncbi:MAG: hypothetical protein U0516_00480 [Candidatus Saccharibacteria bacterium]